MRQTLLLLCALIASLTLAFCLWGAGEPAHAAQYTVCPAGPPACDYATLQAAIDAAGNGDVIKVAAGTYTGVNTRGGLKQIAYIDKSLTICGGYTTSFAEPPEPKVNLTTLDAQGQGRVIYVTGNVSVTLEGLRITGGNATGLMGGPIQEPGRDAGGGIYIITATATISGCEIWNNHAADSGMTGMGGGVYASGGSSVFLIANDIHHNTALASGMMGSGGGVELYNVTVAHIEANTIRQNVAGPSGLGGGLSLGLFSGALISGNVVLSNTAAVSDSGSGGGMYINYAPYAEIKILNNLILSNTASLSTAASSSGGGAHIQAVGPINMNNNVIIGNDAATGSGLFFLGTSSTWGWFQHNTLARNTRGAGISAGDGKIGDNVELYLYNTIIAGHNVGLQTFGTAVALLQTTLWFQNDQDSVGSRIERKDDHYGNPRFAADGYHLQAGSAAIDTGMHAKVTDDIDGDMRPMGAGFDIGADEYRVPDPVTDLRVASVITAADVFTATLRWTAPLYAVTYTLRYSESLITPANWPDAALLTVPFTASAPGQTEYLTVAIAHSGGTAYFDQGGKVYFALKAQNADGVWSALSNNAFWPRREIYLPLVIRKT